MRQKDYFTSTRFFLLCFVMVASGLVGTFTMGCSDDDTSGSGTNDAAVIQDGTLTPDSSTEDLDAYVAPPPPTCEPASGGGSASVEAPELVYTLFDRWHEAWLGSPAVADLDGDGEMEIIVPRHNLCLVWHTNGDTVFSRDVSGRIWSSPVVGDLVPTNPGLEVAVAARDQVFVFDSEGNDLPGFPVTWRDEMRSLAAADIDGDGMLELAAVTTGPLEGSGQRDILIAFNENGTIVDGFPPNTTGSSGCDDRCYVTGGYDQNIALGDVNDDGVDDLFVAQDNAYLSLHEGDGRAFDANAIFSHPTKFLGVRFLHDYDLAQQGWANDEETANQAHFTNSAPAIADFDQDGDYELVILASVQNAAQSDRYRGVALWVINHDGTRPTGWQEPYHVPDYLAGLWDYEGTNVVAATNQVTVANIHPDHTGPEFLFAGFDGKIHAIAADQTPLWTYTYTTDDRVLTGGVIVADLSGDGVPEVVFNSYSPDENKSHLFVLDAAGNELHKLPLALRGAMPVPTIADVDSDGTLEIIVSLKDGEDHTRQVEIYTVPNSADNCLLWPTGRGNLLRNGFVP